MDPGYATEYRYVEQGYFLLGHCRQEFYIEAKNNGEKSERNSTKMIKTRQRCEAKKLEEGRSKTKAT